MKKYLGILCVMFPLSVMFASMAVAAENIRIACAVPLSGPTAQDGKAILNGITLAIEALNVKGGIGGKKVELVVEDDKSDGKEAAAIANKLAMDDSLVGYIGNFSSTCTLAVVPILTRAGIPQVGPCGSAQSLSGLSPYYRKVTPSDNVTGKNMAEWMLDMRYKKAAVVFANNDYGNGIAEIVKKVYAENGGEIVAEESYTPNTSDFGSIIAKIKEKNPDVVFLGSLYMEAANFAKQAHRSNYAPKMAGPTPLISNSLVKLGGGDVNGLMAVGSFSTTMEEPAAQAFTNAYIQRFGEEPSSFAAYAYDAAGIMLQAIASVGTDREVLNKKLSDKDVYHGVTGSIGFNEEGNPIRELKRFVITEGRFVEWK